MKASTLALVGVAVVGAIVVIELRRTQAHAASIEQRIDRYAPIGDLVLGLKRALGI